MRQETITYKIYKFEELRDEAQEKAIEKLYDINIHDDWYYFTYEDAKNIGMIIEAFDIDRGSFLDAKWLFDAQKVAENILSDHGEGCETYEIAKQYLANWDILTEDEKEEQEEEQEKEFFQQLREEYLAMLRREFEYMTSEEAIKESIICNEYEFTSEGELY